MEKTVVLKNVVLEFLSVKPSVNCDAVCYFKFNKGYKKELVKLSKIEKCKLPFWENDRGQYFLKVKHKYVDEDMTLVKGCFHNCEIRLSSYEMGDDDNRIFGYYVSRLVYNTIVVEGGILSISQPAMPARDGTITHYENEQLL